MKFAILCSFIFALAGCSFRQPARSMALVDVAKMREAAEAHAAQVTAPALQRVESSLGATERRVAAVETLARRAMDEGLAANSEGAFKLKEDTVLLKAQVQETQASIVQLKSAILDLSQQLSEAHERLAQAQNDLLTLQEAHEEERRRLMGEWEQERKALTEAKLEALKEAARWQEIAHGRAKQRNIIGGSGIVALLAMLGLAKVNII